MLYVIESSKPLDRVVEDLQIAVARHKFGVLGVHDLKAKMAAKKFGTKGGTLRPATLVKTSGRNIAACQATGAPQSCPTITACVSPSAATSATMSPTLWMIV